MMSKSNITGEIKNFSPKPDEDYYGILVDNGQEEKWLNGKGSIPDDLEKGDRVKIKANMDNFIEIQQIDVIPESGASEAEETRGSDSDNKQSYGESTGSDYTSKDDRINKKVAFKEAVETVRESTDLDLESVESGGEHMDEVAKLANGYYNILSDMGGESSE